MLELNRKTFIPVYEQTEEREISSLYMRDPFIFTDFKRKLICNGHCQGET